MMADMVPYAVFIGILAGAFIVCLLMCLHHVIKLVQIQQKIKLVKDADCIVFVTIGP